MRNLCTIQKVKELIPIEGKDKIVLATMENVGFKVITSKDTNVGDLVVYCEVDTVLPQKPEFEFLRSRCWSPKWDGFRIKAMKMGNVYSEGIMFPISILNGKTPSVGTDVTKEIGAVKYDPEALIEREIPEKKKRHPLMKFLLRFAIFRKLFGVSKCSASPFPPGVHKTDETRVQVLPYVWDYFQNKTVYVTEKLDGQSLTAAYVKGKFYLASRNLTLADTGNTPYHRNAEKYKLKEILIQLHKETGDWWAIQGESIGEGIQGNKLGIKGNDFYVFNVHNVSKDKYMSLGEMRMFCNTHSLNMVPVVREYVYLQELGRTMDELLAFSKGNSVLAPVPREGVVIRATTPLPAGKGMSNMGSFKIINPDFVIKYQDQE